MCSYHSNDGSICIGQIQRFFISKNVTPTCILRNYAAIRDDSPMTELRPPRNRTIRDLNSSLILSKHFISVDMNNSKLVAVPVQRLHQKCVQIQVRVIDQKKTYCIPQPNPYEFH